MFNTWSIVGIGESTRCKRWLIRMMSGPVKGERSSVRDQAASPERDSMFFKDEYIDEIRVNYFQPVLNDVFENYGRGVRLVADVGCGNGLFSASLKDRHGVTLYGYDGSEYALKAAAKRRFDKVILTRDLSSYPLEAENDFFDFVLVKDVLEHLVRPEYALREIVRVMRLGGLVLVSVPNEFNLWKRLRFVFTNNLDTYRYFPAAKEWDRPHIRFFTSRGLRALLELCELQVIKDYSFYFPQRLPIIHKIPPYMLLFGKFASRSPSQFARAIVLLAEKREQRGAERAKSWPPS